MFGVADKIHEDLEDLVPIHHDRRHSVVIADQLNVSALDGGLVDLKGVFNEFFRVDFFQNASDLGIVFAASRR